jgi:hypothetical protein
VGGCLEFVYSSIPRRRRSQLLVHPTSPHRSDGWDGLVWSGVSKAPPAHHSRDSDCDTEKQCPRIRPQHLWTQQPPTQSRPPPIPTPPRPARTELHSHHPTTQPPLSPPLPEPSLTPTFRLSLLRLYIPATTSLHVPSHQPVTSPTLIYVRGHYSTHRSVRPRQLPPPAKKGSPAPTTGAGGAAYSVQFSSEERRGERAGGGWWVG